MGKAGNHPKSAAETAVAVAGSISNNVAWLPGTFGPDPAYPPSPELEAANYREMADTLAEAGCDLLCSSVRYAGAPGGRDDLERGHLDYRPCRAGAPGTVDIHRGVDHMMPVSHQEAVVRAVSDFIEGLDDACSAASRERGQ